MSPWIAVTERTVTERVSASPADVRAFYLDLDNIKAVHPLVVAVETVARSETPQGYVQTYRVRDRIPLGPLTLPISYEATLTVPVVGDVVADSRQFPQVRLHTVVSFEPVGAGTEVAERMRISAPRPLFGTTVRQAVAAHRTMLAGIRDRFS
ncbi:SRPBCC family protein [Mycolicibacterium komossense]|uniref:SRPBCC family protein n=1 Tax=Mycolicibacterium komossense TaxID=1779 RepID=A0ABT3CJ60_9MYCO|nr:SRPBCC family protein [Mycolicibacterium komossense]MCV7229353.1 SRPBCC family protein [Mycolicibacterium komossense]